MAFANSHPNIQVSAVSPGWVQTNMGGSGAELTPEQGCLSTRHCLFKKLGGNGWYYGSDAKRSPLHATRNPGGPEFQGY